MPDPTAPPSDSSAQPPAGKQPHGGLSAVELAAERGIGPLSPLGLKVWHGDAYPCASCGELVRRSALVCESCSQDLSLKMIVKMQAHAGPWYVHEHVRPFPGVTLDRLVRQVQRGVLTATTIVRGPTTYHQWRFAAETPALSKHLDLCWNCQSKVTATDTRCSACHVDLDRPAGEDAPAYDGRPPEPVTTPAPEKPRAVPVPTTAAAPQPPDRPADASDIARIQSALGAAGTSHESAKRHLPMVPIIVAIVVFAILSLLLVVKLRSGATAKSRQSAPVAAPTPATTVTPTGAAGAEQPAEE